MSNDPQEVTPYDCPDPPSTPEDAWQELLDKDDRTSPSEYPEMCLITFEELRGFMDRAIPKAERPAS